jgi:hypothetical protein
MQPSGQPRPDPNNPYAQQPTQGAGTPNYGYPQAQTPGGYGPMTPPGGSAPQRGPGGLPSWLWAVGGVVIASAVWGSVLVATAGSDEPPPEPAEPRPNLAGYQYSDDMCETADTSAFDTDYEPDDYNESIPLAYENRAIDASACTFYYTPIGDAGYTNGLFLTHEAVWHRGANPRSEFAARFESQDQYSDSGDFAFSVETVDGLGDEAFIVYETRTDSDQLSRATLGVREGWFEYTLTWDGFFDSYGDFTHLTEETQVNETMRESAEETLAALRGEQQQEGDEGEEGEEDYDGSVPGDPDV